MIFIITARKTQMAMYWGQIPLFWTKPFGTFGAAQYSTQDLKCDVRFPCPKPYSWLSMGAWAMPRITNPGKCETHCSFGVEDRRRFLDGIPQLTENMAFPLAMAHPVSYLSQATGVRTYPGTSNLGSTRGTRAEHDP